MPNTVLIQGPSQMSLKNNSAIIYTLNYSPGKTKKNLWENEKEICFVSSKILLDKVQTYMYKCT